MHCYGVSIFGGRKGLQAEIPLYALRPFWASQPEHVFTMYQLFPQAGRRMAFGIYDGGLSFGSQSDAALMIPCSGKALCLCSRVDCMHKAKSIKAHQISNFRGYLFLLVAHASTCPCQVPSGIANGRHCRRRRATCHLGKVCPCLLLLARLNQERAIADIPGEGF